MADDDPILMVFCTAPDQATAKVLSEGLLAEGLAACVSAMPGMISRYRWQGKLETEEEVQLLIKTVAGQWDGLKGWLQTHHPYDNPEIVALSAAHAADEYRQWVHEICGHNGG